MKFFPIIYLVIPVFLIIFSKEAKAQTKEIPVASVKLPDTSIRNTNYPGNRPPLLPLFFIKLPVGSIEPGGWIKRYLELQRDGLTGKLGEISAWLDKKNNAWYSGTGKGDHGWEEVPYWLKGYGDLGYLLHDKSIFQETKSWLEKVFQSQQASGFFGPGEVETNQQGAIIKIPDLWPNMIMLWCLQSYFDYTGDKRVIPFMTNYFRWQLQVPDSLLLKTYWENSRGGDNLYSVYWLYNQTGEKWLLNLGEKIHRNTADWTKQNDLPNWHNVNIAQSFREPATYFLQARDAALRDASYHDFWLVRNLYGQVPGGMFGADENARKGFDDPRQAVETCGMVEQMSSDELLTGITGDVLWADNCENVAFNTYPAAVMPDFRALRYLTAPNMVVSDSKNHSPGIQNKGPFLMMNPFSSRCCQHNHAQGWPYYAEHLWMATPDNGLAAILYNTCKVIAKVGNRGGDQVMISAETHYPFDENVSFTVVTKKDVLFPLYLRIPGWCRGAEVFVNGQRLEISILPSSYAKIERIWKDGDKIKLRLPMKVSLQQWEANKNSVSIEYGPLTFSLRIAESYKQMDSRASAIGDSKWQPVADQTKWPSYEIYPASSWNYGIVLTDQPLNTQFVVTKKPWPADNFPFSQENVPLEISAKGKLIPQWQIDEYGLCGVLPESPVVVNTKADKIKLIPMGAARLRISAFPVVK